MVVLCADGTDGSFCLEGKTVVVTGATSGLGREAAAQCARLGAHVVLACRNVKAAEEVVKDIRKQNEGAVIQVGPQLDLSSTRAIRNFVKEYEKQGLPLHLLVNNAGANYMPDWQTDEGVPGIVQVNYLGPYMLTRLLEPRLIASAPSRVVNLSSVTHRYGEITSAAAFLQNKEKGLGKEYPATKLANTLFAFEHQRRLGHLGVQSCAVDPGSVATSIYRDSPLFSRPPASWVISGLYSPPRDGARIIVDAARAPWGASRPRQPPDGNGQVPREGFSDTSGCSSDEVDGRGDLRFFARGVFRSPAVSWYPGGGPGLINLLQTGVWAASTLGLSLLDWPLRNLSQGKLLGVTGPVAAAPAAYDARLARDLWDLSADIVGVPRDPITSSSHIQAPKSKK